MTGIAAAPAVEGAPRAAPRAHDLPEVRNLRFDLDRAPRPRYWFGGRRALTIFLDNLSIFFPPGESFFIRSVKEHRHLAAADPALAAAVRAFCAQEGIHTREHAHYNRMLLGHGYRALVLERRVERLLALVDRVLPARSRLAATAALEHFTAVMGHVVLGDPKATEGADPVMAALWRWHAAEEYEHKAVAFDLYRLAGGGYAERAAIMVGATAIFWWKVLEQQVALMRDAGIALDLAEWRDLGYALAVEPGVLRHVARCYFDWFRPGFHPLDLECLAPLARWRDDYARSPVYEASRRSGAAGAGPRRPARGAAGAGAQGEVGEALAADGPAAPGGGPDLEVAIVGAGFSGLGMAIRLQQEGERSFALFEKGDDVGGTWRENRYPGCACDVPAHLYSFSFEPNPLWSRRFAPQPEILAYLRACAAKHGLYAKTRFGAEIAEARFDDRAGIWRLRTRAGERTSARHLVLGIGALHRPALPAIRGRERFAGEALHSARWEPRGDFRGKTVAVIGTGASAIQLIPRLAREAERLVVFQRTPPWVLPRADRAFSAVERAIFARVPLAREVYRAWTYASLEWRALGLAIEPRLMRAIAWAGERHLRRQVRDSALRARLTPRYTPGCKRILLSDDYYPALAEPHVEVVTEAIEEIDERGIRTTDGRHRALDAIVYATGFQVTDPPPPGLIVGRGGLDLAEAWGARMQAYLGTTVAGFPNLFHLVGPNTGLGHNSMVFMIEAQIDHALACIRAAARKGATVEVREEAQARYNAALTPRLARSVWGSGCQSWYLDPSGHNPTIWPGFTVEFWWRTRSLRTEDYTFAPVGAHVAASAAARHPP